MARPAKKGLEYFPLDINPDRKTKLLIKKFGLIGEAVYITLLKQIYSEGYFLKIDDEFFEDFSIEYGIPEGELSKVFEFLLHKEFFCEFYYFNEKVLTSIGIQSRFLAATKKRSTNNIVDKFRINEDSGVVTDTETLITDTETLITDTESTQSKVKNSKGNKSKEIEKRKEDFRTHIFSLNFDLPKSEIDKFIEYWCECGIGDDTMRFEEESKFGIPHRLKRWKDRIQDFNPETEKPPEETEKQKRWKLVEIEASKYSDRLSHLIRFRFNYSEVPPDLKEEYRQMIQEVDKMISDGLKKHFGEV